MISGHREKLPADCLRLTNREQCNRYWGQPDLNADALGRALELISDVEQQRFSVGPLSLHAPRHSFAEATNSRSVKVESHVVCFFFWTHVPCMWFSKMPFDTTCTGDCVALCVCCSFCARVIFFSCVADFLLFLRISSWNLPRAS